MKIQAFGAALALLAAPLPARELAFFYAVDADLAALKAQATAGPIRRLSVITVTPLTVGPHKIYAVKMGAGGMRTAVTATALLSRFPCDLAISVGPTGRLSGALAIGQCVRVTEVVAYQRGSETTAGFALAKDATTDLRPAFSPPDAAPRDLKDAAAVRLASGELFIASDSFREELRAETKAQAVDMNLAGLAEACAAANVPLVAWKIVSDSANDSAAADFQKFTADYAGGMGSLIAELLKTLPANATDPKAHPNLKALLDSTTNAGKK